MSDVRSARVGRGLQTHLPAAVPAFEEFTMKRVQQGFTLIELMIVVAIIGILAAVALPAYQDYTVRAKLTEVMTAASSCKTGVAEFIQSNGAFPADAQAAGCSTAAANSSISKYVQNITVADDTGAVTVEIQGTGITALDNASLVLQPTANNARTTALATAATPIAGWSCGTAADAALYKYFPAPCRQAVLGGL
jgi:type IV pilus assembly protein PilA